MIEAQVFPAEAGEARRRIFHLRALQALQVAASAAELAYHALSGGLAEPAFHWSLIAGDEALREFAVRDALCFFEQAQHLLAARVNGPGLLSLMKPVVHKHLPAINICAREMTSMEIAEGNAGKRFQTLDTNCECQSMNSCERRRYA